jgi:hypothetical protein
LRREGKGGQIYFFFFFGTPCNEMDSDHLFLQDWKAAATGGGPSYLLDYPEIKFQK